MPESDRVREVAKWLQRTGFPFDWVNAEAPPEFLIRPLAEAWYAADAMRADETVEVYEIMIREELAGVAPRG